MKMGSRYKFGKEKMERRRKEIKDKRAETRLKVMELRAKGATAKEVPAATGLHAAYVTQLVAKYRKNGLEAISGNHRNMGVKEEAGILAPFKVQAEKGELVEIREIRKRGFRNEVFATLEKAVDRLCDTISSFPRDVIFHITKRHWISEAFY